MDLVLEETKTVIQAFGLLVGLFNKLLAKFFKRFQFAALNFEIGYDRTTFVLGRLDSLL